jgi:class 3 adenylate cyclase
VPELISVSTRASLAVPPGALWALLADTDRLNRAIKLPPVRFVPVPDPGKKGHYQAETSFLGMRLSYEEFPFDFVEGRHYRVVRRFASGPLREIAGGVRLAPSGAGTELEVFADVVPRTWFGAWIARRFLAKKANEDVLGLARALERHLREPGAGPAPALPPPGNLHPEVLEARLASVACGGPVGKLRDELLTASDLEVVRLRPFERADRWGEDRMATLALFLHAARAGVLDLAWCVLCPNCRVAAQRVLTLAELRSQVHCETCGIGFGTDFAGSVEARFAVNPAVREARRETFCIGGPANMPEIVAQLRLEPGELRKEPFDSGPSGPFAQGKPFSQVGPSGPLRVRCYQAPGILPLSGTRVAVEAGGLRVEAGEPGLLEVRNALSSEALVVVERETWKETAATAALVTSLQDFRDLYPSEAVAPGEEIGIASLAILFTDLKGSTELYQRVGDPKAFSFVQNHFRYLTEAVARHRGGVVKTMGDAVMATFARGRDALEAAVEMQARWEAFRLAQGDAADLALKVGLHLGPAIAIHNAGKLDYFGTTVNTAARVQGQAVGGDVVVTRALAEDPEASAFLRASGLSPEPLTVALKGLEGEHALFRLRP